ncbi:RHS repeat protein [Rhizobium laguerreae]|nr:RHS repeat protein [Rhizobium laguerreae]
MRDPKGAQWTYTYDLLGNRLTASDPDLGNWSYAYDDARCISPAPAPPLQPGPAGRIGG